MQVEIASVTRPGTAKAYDSAVDFTGFDCLFLYRITETVVLLVVDSILNGKSCYSVG